MNGFGMIARANGSSPLGCLTRAAPMVAKNEDRFTAAHCSQPVGVVANKVLTAKARAHIKPANFALPGGRYPINDKVHARNALARVAQHGTPAEQAKVRAAVHRKFPGIGG